MIRANCARLLFHKCLKEQNGFKLFDIEQEFEIDQHKLQREMHKLQKVLHPDKFIGKNIKTQQISVELSAKVNDLYRTLSHPYERGKYLLSLMTNIGVDEVEKKLDSIRLDGKFLARMMDIGERVNCPTSDTMALRQLNSELDKDLADLARELKEDFALKKFDNIYKTLGKLKFLANCHDSIIDRLRSLENF